MIILLAIGRKKNHFSAVSPMEPDRLLLPPVGRTTGVINCLFHPPSGPFASLRTPMQAADVQIRLQLAIASQPPKEQFLPPPRVKQYAYSE